LLGHEGSGEVIDIGEGVSKIKAGDNVVLGWIKGEGINAPGANYQMGDIKVNSGSVTTFTEYAIVAENRCVKIPEGFPIELAPLLGCAVPTGAGLVLNTLKPKAGSSIAFFGLGGIGLSAMLAMPSFDCSPIIAIDVELHKLELAKELGATHIIDASKVDPISEINKITHGKGVDYSVEAAGFVETIEQAFGSINTSTGTCIFASHPEHGKTIKLDPFELLCGKRILGSNGGDSMPDIDIPKYVELYKAGKLEVGRLLSHTYSLNQINDAFNDLQNRKVTRAMIDFNLD
jgi:S-(hydroxymethyl)glutathione dehydrogenase/alcohol dehydrogenase